MPAWDDLLNDYQAALATGQENAGGQWFMRRIKDSLGRLAQHRGRPVLMYGSAFLQKPTLPGQQTMITYEDLNGLMSTIYGLDATRGVTLVLHTPGGITSAAETIVAYLRSKFPALEVIVPTLAMSAGTMISLAADNVIMGRQSQLGPIDPQMNFPGGRTVSARAVVDQFERAKSEVSADLSAAHVWHPMLSSLGPSLLQEAINALGYAERMVAEWLSQWMFAGRSDAEAAGKTTAQFFNDASTHMSHSRRIDRDEARAHDVVVEDLEDDQELQEIVLTAYHVLTLAFEQTAIAKAIWNSEGRTWHKNHAVA